MAQIDRERFATFLYTLRKEKGFTQQELADKLFVSNKAVSKWERGQSLPDIALLTPLAEALGVTVAELLRGERLPRETMETREAAELVDKAIRLTAEEERRSAPRRRSWRLWWALSALLGVGETLFLLLKVSPLTGLANDTVLVTEALSILFGGWFCLFARERLPAYYDENRINYYTDGIFRLHLSGIRLNNSNWPHILRVGRVWLTLTAALYPPVFGLLALVVPAGARQGVQLGVTLFFCTGFLLPMLIVGKKYE